MIYKVKIKDWYCNLESEFYKELDNLKEMLPKMKCIKCGGPITLENGWVDHSVTFQGYFDDMAVCSDECYKNIKETKL